ncbi:T9SS type A sorting domain-containing protein, partial [bacterium]|nr:T9SS type A sorting domain-containing protein [bacterium]
KAFKLEQNYPNPFNPVTKIQFALANDDVVTVKVFDVTGREVATLLDQSMKAGQHVVSFDAANFTSGIYFYQMKTTSFSAVKQMILLK